MKELRFSFYKVEDEFGFNADVIVWVKQDDSVAAMRAAAAQKAKLFLSEMLASIEAEYPAQAK